ncbi:MAG TPA: PAS domain-containing protein, partial [Anaeromyxobacteraceae bacterium]|nr:PAS domain-containing protein [Anaeromyxobacteraceae bacterium]
MSWPSRGDLALDLIDQARAFLVVVDRDRHVLVWNAWASQLTGRGADAVLGTDLFRFVAADAQPGLEKVLALGFAGEGVRGTDTRLVRADGS